MTAVPALAEVYRLVERTDMSREEVAPYLGFKAGNYSRWRKLR